MKQKHRNFSVLLSCAILMTSAVSLPAFFSVSAAEDSRIQTFPMSDVTMTDAYSVNAYEKEIAYLLSYDTERLLAGFRDNAGLPMNGVSRYDGWESLLLGGHTAGHFMTAIAQAYVNPLTTDTQKSQLLNMMKKMADGLQA